MQFNVIPRTCDRRLPVCRTNSRRFKSLLNKLAKPLSRGDYIWTKIIRFSSQCYQIEHPSSYDQDDFVSRKNGRVTLSFIHLPECLRNKHGLGVIPKTSFHPWCFKFIEIDFVVVIKRIIAIDGMLSWKRLLNHLNNI